MVMCCALVIDVQNMYASSSAATSCQFGVALARLGAGHARSPNVVVVHSTWNGPLSMLTALSDVSPRLSQEDQAEEEVWACCMQTNMVPSCGHD
eukprot:5137418-Amphidinium_carterae.2